MSIIGSSDKHLTPGHLRAQIGLKVQALPGMMLVLAFGFGFDFHIR